MRSSDGEKRPRSCSGPGVRNPLANTPFEGVGTVTVCAGVCSTENVRDADTLVRDDDRALYRAKDSGRNSTFRSTDEARATSV